MAKRGDGYGSEDHLLRYWTDQRKAFEKSISKAVGWPDGRLDWIYPANVTTGEPEGLTFLSDHGNVEGWKEFWPQTGTQPCWDGVARFKADLKTEWALIEAKANHAEFCTPPCGAAKHGGRPQIERALNATKQHLGVHRDFSWLGSYYQHANRLATLYFLSTRGIRAHLIDLLFVGDSFPDQRRCPQNESDWRELLKARQLTLGLPDRHALSDQLHEVFLPALPRALPASTSTRAVAR
jgi:hypothetical protein